jgi:hypothetical protein
MSVATITPLQLPRYPFRSEPMKVVVDRVVAMMLGFFACVAQAAMEDGSAAAAAEPTVSVIWVVVFLAIFVGICAWIGIAIWRNERKNAGKAQANAKI